MSLYIEDKEEIKEMINKVIAESQLKPNKLVSDEITEYSLMWCFPHHFHQGGHALLHVVIEGLYCRWPQYLEILF